jgi:hypothetical protein
MKIATKIDRFSKNGCSLKVSCCSQQLYDCCLVCHFWPEVIRDTEVYKTKLLYVYQLLRTVRNASILKQFAIAVELFDMKSLEYQLLFWLCEQLHAAYLSGAKHIFLLQSSILFSTPVIERCPDYRVQTKSLWQCILSLIPESKS